MVVKTPRLSTDSMEVRREIKCRKKGTYNSSSFGVI